MPATNPKAGRKKKRPEFIVSACLAGVDCTYDARNKLNPSVKRLVETGLAIPTCPEVTGGAAIPRRPCEIASGDGEAVLAGGARVINSNGEDVTAVLLSGARKTLRLAKKHNIKKFILKSNSPSCGSGAIYDGSFSSTLIKGDGVTAAILKGSGISVFTEKEISRCLPKSIL